MTTITGNFNYTTLITDYKDADFPFIFANDGSGFGFTTLDKTFVDDGLNRIVNYSFVFVKNGVTNDGLQIKGKIENPNDIKINTFGSVPLSREG
jgi:hypothetical protein